MDGRTGRPSTGNGASAPWRGASKRRDAWDPGEAAVFRKLRERLPDLLPHDPAPSLLHGDLWSGNFLASRAGTGPGDPAAYSATGRRNGP